MPTAAYRLQRVSDGEEFDELCASDAEALAKLGQKVGEELTFEGSGDPPYLLGKRSDTTTTGWMGPDIPVYLRER